MYCGSTPSAVGQCNWVGELKEYQAHARLCSKNSEAKIIEVAAPGQGHLEECYAICPFSKTDPSHPLVTVSLGDRLAVLEHPEVPNGGAASGWVFGKNLTKLSNSSYGTEEEKAMAKALGGPGWFPRYCIPVKSCEDPGIDRRLYNQHQTGT